MGVPVLPSNTDVRSMVRLPNSGWDTTLQSSVLDLSRSSGLAATVHIGRVPFLTRNTVGASNVPGNNTNAAKLVERDPLAQVQENKVNFEEEKSPQSEAKPKETSVKATSKQAFKKACCKPAKKRASSKKAAGNSTSAKGISANVASKGTKRQRPNDLHVEPSNHCSPGTSVQSNGVEVFKFPQMNGAQSGFSLAFQARKVILVPVSNQSASGTVMMQVPQQKIMPLPKSTQPSPSVLVLNGVQQLQQGFKTNVNKAPQPIQLTLKQPQPLEQVQQPLEQVQQPVTGVPAVSLEQLLQTRQPCNALVTGLKREKEELKALNSQLKQRVLNYQNLFKDKKKLQAVVNILYNNQPLVH